MTEQKSRRKAERFYDERTEESDIQAITKRPSRTIYGRATKKTWKWTEYVRYRMKNF